MKLFGRKSKKNESGELPAVVQTAQRELLTPFVGSGAFSYNDRCSRQIYRELRESIPVIDAALDKLVRLIGKFHIECEDDGITAAANSFIGSVRSGTRQNGLYGFISVYMNELLTYGTAAGEIVLTGDGRSIYSLVNVPLDNIELEYDENMIDALVCRPGISGDREPFECQELLLVTALNPEPGKLWGVSVLHGLPFVSDILMKIYGAIGVNWERVGNVRFAVTYKPTGDIDRSMSRQRAKQIAEEWTKAIRDKNTVSDFVSVGDVSIKVIGADNQVLDSEVPVRTMLEQIVAKLSVPPFLLGLSWSTTERMSSQQADILTSELEYYRCLIDGVIAKIVGVWMRLSGFDEPFEIVWDNVNLQDELELAKARLYNAQAAQTETLTERRYNYGEE